MKYFKLKFLLIFAALAMALPPAWAETETVVFSEQGYTNGQAMSTYTGDNFSILFDEGTGNNGPKYYTSGEAIRLYGGNYMVVSSDYVITEIVITFGSSDGSNGITASVGTYDKSSGTWTGGGTEKSVKFTVSGTSGNRRIAAVSVTYDSGGSTPNPKLTVGVDDLTINDSGTNNSFTVKGEYLKDNIGVKRSPTSFEPTLTATVGQGRDNWDNGVHYFWFERSGEDVDGTVAVNYTGTDLYAEGTITMGTKPYADAPDDEDITKTVSVYYRPDIYILGNFGDGWNFNDQSHKMTFNGTNYIATVQMPANSYFVFARKLTESSEGLWNDGRSYFGPSYNNWPVNGNVTDEDLALDQHNVFKVNNAGVYTVTIDPEGGTFSIISTNVANIDEAQAFEGPTFTYMGSAVVTYQNGENLWIRDNSGSGLIVGNTDIAFENGDILAAGWSAGNAMQYSTIPIFNNPTGIAKGEGTAVADPLPLTEITSDDVNKYASMSGVTVTAVSGKKYTVTLNDVQSILYDQFQLFTSNPLKVGHIYNVVGVVTIYSGTPELYLTEVEDITPMNVTLQSETTSATVGNEIPVTVVVENADGDYVVTYKFGENGTVNTLTDGNVINVTSEIAGEVTLYVTVTNNGNEATAQATYTFTEPALPGSNVFTKVTSSTLEPGKKYILALASTTSAKAMGAINASNHKGTIINDLTLNDDGTIDISGHENEVVVFTVDGELKNYTFAFPSGNYLRWTSSTNIEESSTTDINAKWSAVDDRSKGYYIRNNATESASTKRAMMFRGDVISAYATTDSQSEFAYLYVQTASTPEPELAVTLPEAPEEHYKVGQVVKVKATVENGSENTVLTYKVGDETLTIGEDGNVTLPNKKAGDVVLTVTAVDGDKQATDTKTYVFDAADELTITLNPATGSYYVGDVKNVTVTVEGAIATNPTITYKFGEEEAQTYDAETGIVLPTAQAGTINLTVMVDDDGYEHAGATTATGTYTVNHKALTITLDPATAEFTVGAEAKVKVTIENAVGTPTVTYKIGDDTVEPVEGYIVLPNTKAVENMNLTVTARDEREGAQDVVVTGTYKFNAAPAIQIGFNPENGHEFTVGQEAKVLVTVEESIGDDVIEIFVNDEKVEADESGYITLPNTAAGNVTVTVKVTDDYDHVGEDENGVTAATATYHFNAAPAITFDLVADPDQENYTVGDVVNVKVENIKNVIGDDVQILYTTNFTRDDEPQTYDPEKGIDITSNEAGTVTLQVAITDGYEHAAAAEKSADYKFNAAEAIEIAFDPVDGTIFNVGVESKVKVTVTGTVGDDVTVTYMIGEETVEPVDGYIVLPNNAVGDVTLTVNVNDGVEHEGATSATATYHFAKQNATVAFGIDSDVAVLGTAYTAPTATTTPAGLEVTYTSSDETVATVNENGEVTLQGEGTTTITATVVGNDMYNGGATASYTLTVQPMPVVAMPEFSLVSGSYTGAQTLNITCATEGAVISYSTNGGNSWTQGNTVNLTEDCTIIAKAEKAGMAVSAEANAYYIIDMPVEIPTLAGGAIKGYFAIKNNGNGMYANVQGRKTLNFTDAIDQQAGTVIWVETNEKGQVQSLRSQGADLQGYADRAMRYVPELVELAVNKLHAEGAGNILGEHGLDEIMAKFNESFDHHLYVEDAEGGYRLYGRTPSMQPVVDFYREHTHQVETKLPMLVDFINSTIDKILEKTNGAGTSVLKHFDLHETWERMGGTLTEPVDSASTMAFYREVLNNKNYVWDFAYETAMTYWERVKASQTYQENVDQLGEFADYLDMIEQVRPDFKYYVVQENNKPDYISQGNKDIINNAARTIWTLESRADFMVSVTEENQFGCPYADGVGGYGTTLYTDFAYDLSEAVTAYKVTGVKNGNAVLEALTGTIPAQTPVLLVAKAAGDYTLSLSTATPAAVTGNLLVGVDYLINRFELKTAQVETLFNLVKSMFGDSFYESYVKEYEHLMMLNAGTVNNKYFWGLSNSDLQKCVYVNENNKKDCVVRNLVGGEFVNNWQAPTANKAFLVSETDATIALSSLRGDVNHDGVVNIHDVTALINHLLTNHTSPACPYCSDVYQDSKLTIKDVTALINLILSNGGTLVEN